MTEFELENIRASNVCPTCHRPKQTGRDRCYTCDCNAIRKCNYCREKFGYGIDQQDKILCDDCEQYGYPGDIAAHIGR